PAGIVTVRNTDGLTSSGVTLVILDATLSAAGTSFSIPKGDTYNGVVATFTSGNPNATPGDFSAVIDWGDGTAGDNHTTIGTTSGHFTVSGSHVYGSVGTFVVTATITSIGGAQAIATGPVFWSSAADAPDARRSALAVTAPNGLIYLMGGLVEQFS